MKEQDKNKENRAERLFGAIGQVDEKLLTATEPTIKKRKNYITRILAAAAVLALVFLGAKLVFTPAGGSGKEGSMMMSEEAKGDANGGMEPEGNPKEDLSLEGAMPETVSADGLSAVTFFEASVSEQQADYSTLNNTVSGSLNGGEDKEQLKKSEGKTFTSWLTAKERTRTLLAADAGENTAISPLCISMEMAMLAELSDGDSRGELLDKMGYGKASGRNIKDLRETVQSVWGQTYYDTEDGTACRYANALWLRNDAEYNSEKLMKAAEFYNTSSYAGKMGSSEYDRLHQEWLTNSSCGLLENAAKEETFKEITEMGVTSTIYYKAPWKEPLRTVEDQTFYGTGKNRTVDMLHNEGKYRVFREKNFSAVAVPLKDGKNLYLFLPDAGKTVSEIYEEDGYQKILQGEESGEEKAISLYFPQFDITVKQDLKAAMQQFGIKGIFENGSSFSKLMEKRAGTVTKLSHAVRFKVDSGGITAAAYTDATVDEGCIAEKEIRFDRPFLFAVADDRGVIFFEGVKQN